MKRIALGMLLMTGCAGKKIDVEKGLQVLQNGLAVVDVAVDKLADDYVVSVKALRAHCKGDANCEKKFKVTDEDVAKTADALEELSKVYDTTAETASTVGKTWRSLSPVVEEARKAAQNVGAR